MPLASRLLRFGLALLLLSGAKSAFARRAVQAGDLTVTTALDEYDISGAGTGCSIREAIQAANTDLPFGGCAEGTGVDTINIPAGTYTLTRAGINEDANERGDLDIASEVILAGDGVGVTILQAGTRPDLGDSVDRVLHVLGCEGRLTITGLTVQHGFAQSNLLPNYRGGGIYIDGGVLDAQDCAIRGNRALQHGGGILNLGGNVTVDNCSLEGNVADYYGGAVYNRDGPFLISDSSLANNESVFWGGAVFNTSGGKLAIQRSTLDNNRVTGPGTPATSLAGGAIFCQPGAGPTTVEASTLSRNYGGDLGGAIYAAATVNVSNSTLSGNTADQGGGVYFVGTANISSSTITENQALGGGGGIRRGFELNINNTIVAGNPTGADCYGSFGDVLGDHNLDGDGSCGFNAAGDISVADPRLGPLLDHGGPTRTHALLFDSPAIDAGSTGGCRDHQNMSIASDQRSEARDDLRCDIGAFELVYQGSPTVSKAVTGGGEVTFGPTLVRIA
ncbi:MAG TPA: CSLREA domain-containing protein, partial [Anaerolineae bacterium]|nr:CSLREA domain-containing protein [Anaerolineae bacterium]